MSGALVAVGLVRLNRALIAPFRRPDQEKVVDVLYLSCAASVRSSIFARAFLGEWVRSWVRGDWLV